MVCQSLNTTDLELAKARRTQLAKKAGAEKWADVDALKSRRTVALLRDVFMAYTAAATGRDLEADTAAHNLNALRNIIRQVHGAAFDSATTTAAILTPELLDAYQTKAMAGAGADYLARERTKRTVRSTIIQARSVFARWTSGVYKHLNLPDLAGFRNFHPNRAETNVYRLPPQVLIERTIAGARRLRTASRDSQRARYAAFLCCYDLALRAGEAVALRKDWFEVLPVKDPVTGQIAMRRFLKIIRRADFKPKWNKERTLPVSEEVWTHLQEILRSEDPYVLPGGAFTTRDNLVKRQFARWLRKIGWSAREYPKAAHELRKLMGSRWFTELGAEVAQEWLGHRNVATTCSFYATLRSQPKALAMEGLRPTPAPLATAAAA
jgi:integrase